jgi:hypothetical protein
VADEHPVKPEISNLVEELLRHRCTCPMGKNKVLLEAVSACPDCYSFFSTVTAEIPPEKLRPVLERFLQVLQDLDVEARGLERAMQGIRKFQEGGDTDH